MAGRAEIPRESIPHMPPPILQPAAHRYEDALDRHHETPALVGQMIRDHGPRPLSRTEYVSKAPIKKAKSLMLSRSIPSGV